MKEDGLKAITFQLHVYIMIYIRVNFLFHINCADNAAKNNLSGSHYTIVTSIDKEK